MSLARNSWWRFHDVFLPESKIKSVLLCKNLMASPNWTVNDVVYMCMCIPLCIRTVVAIQRDWIGAIRNIEVKTCHRNNWRTFLCGVQQMWTVLSHITLIGICVDKSQCNNNAVIFRQFIQSNQNKSNNQSAEKNCLRVNNIFIY